LILVPRHVIFIIREKLDPLVLIIRELGKTDSDKPSMTDKDEEIQ